MPVDFVRDVLDTAPRMGFAHRNPTASGTVASIAQPHTAGPSLAESHPSPRGSLLPCRGAPPTMARPTRTTDEAAAVLGCSVPTARRALAEWALWTAMHGCLAAADDCVCARGVGRGRTSWPHTTQGTAGPRGGRPGYVTDAAQLDVHAARLRVLEGREAA